MPSLDTHSSTSVVRLINLGVSGAGKTGALVSLVLAGYRLHIIDTDNNLNILANELRRLGRADLLGAVQYETLRDSVYMLNGIPKVRAATAYKAVGKLLTAWKLDEMTASDIIVIDTLTSLTEAAFHAALTVGSRLNQRPQQTDYGWLADSVKLLIEALTDDSLKCNLIVNAHVRYLGLEEEVATGGKEGELSNVIGLPNARGQEISRTIAGYFNTMVLTKVTGSGPAAKRAIHTVPQQSISLKTAALTVKSSYPIESGLATLFADILGTTPSSVPLDPKAPAPTVQSIETNLKDQ